MKRKIALLSLSAAFTFAASSAFACPYMKQDQVTQAPMSPIASAPSVEEPLQSSVATNDLKTVAPVTATTDEKAAE